MSLSLHVPLQRRPLIVNRPTLRALLALVSAGLCAALLASCGDAPLPADGAAASALEETLAATSKLHDGRMTGSFKLEPEGLLALGGPIVLSASGPFAAPAVGKGPRFDLALAAAIAGESFKAGASSTGEQAFLRLDGRDYALGRDRPSAHAKSGTKRGALPSLGLDPLAWITDPRTKSASARIGGVDTIAITGKLDVRRLLADVAKLLDGGEPGRGLLTAKLQRQIVDAVKSATVEIATGAQDKILRRLTAVIDFDFPKDSTPPVTGLDGGRINLRLSLDGIDTTSFEVAAPKHPRPLSQLLGAGGLGAFLRGLGAGLSGGAGTGNDGTAFLRCVATAGGRTAEVMHCTSKLAP
jgi:hypothetical protein